MVRRHFLVLSARPVPSRRMDATLVRWMGVEDANSGGFVHGGTVMRLCDEAAALAAVRHCRRRCVTGGMDRMTFASRVDIGELLTLYARVNAVWRTSMEVGVRVQAENVRTGEIRHTSTAYLTMVALDDDDGTPVAVPPLPIDDDDVDGVRRQSEAQLRRANRLAERKQFLRDRGWAGAGGAPGAEAERRRDQESSSARTGPISGATAWWWSRSASHSGRRLSIQRGSSWRTVISAAIGRHPHGAQPVPQRRVLGDRGLRLRPGAQLQVRGRAGPRAGP